MKGICNSRIYTSSIQTKDFNMGDSWDSVVALMLLMLFYIDSMNQEIEAVDNDGDSFDSDGDGYPDGPESLYGTNEYSRDDNPGNFDPPIAPDDPSKWINEDDFNGTKLQKP